ncbi:hypothetical protein A1O7_05928 [Cladophialophora yegresii CBS 114405]|uniref:Uncharacterized protein n=1 Tax=Cladophialophora yegresii CBS 114405 TaxID=1182544 RepID=W9VS02_9EURO|nr:uncharacterized protein A1O7_05928 [Cladophialophora yegresii CBS 114405]EXJ58502.1 hypothetical protein A1O7_05928 [Cladophialophora yegresii CBS 114405]
MDGFDDDYQLDLLFPLQAAPAFQYLSPTHLTQTSIWASVDADLNTDDGHLSWPLVHDIIDDPPINTAAVDAPASFHVFPQDVTDMVNRNSLSDSELFIGIDIPPTLHIPQAPRVPGSSHAFHVTGNCEDPAHLRRRRRRCLCCQVDKGNRPCLGYPLCQRCSILPGIKATPPSLTDILYLDWRLWFFLCRDLGQNIAPFREEFLSASPMPFGARAPVVLELELQDRMPSCYLSSNHLVVFEPDLGKQSFVSVPEPDQTLVRAPTIRTSQLDSFVTGSVWGEAYSVATSHKLSGDEIALFSTARLFTGYFCLLHNLGNTVIDSGSTFDISPAQLLSMELIYTLAYRLQMLFAEFAKLCTKVTQKNADKKKGRKTHAVVVLYALEVVYRVVVSMKTCTWDVPAENPFHPLLRLWTGFQRQSRNILSRILAYECYYSGLDNEGSRMKLPPIVKFAREGSCRSLPSHLSIFPQRHRPIFLTDPFPSLNKGRSNQYLVDLLACPDNDFWLSVAKGSSRPRKRFPEYMVAENNSKVFRSEVAVTTKDDSECTRSNPSVKVEATLPPTRLNELELLSHTVESPCLQAHEGHDVSSSGNQHFASDASYIGVGVYLDSSQRGISPSFTAIDSDTDGLQRLLASFQRWNRWVEQRNLDGASKTPPVARLSQTWRLKQACFSSQRLKRKRSGPMLAFRD